MLQLGKIAAIVVTYNRKEMLKECVAAIRRQTVGCDILIVDNASTDGTAETVRSLTAGHSDIQYFNTGSNTGGAGGFNYGMRKAAECGYDYLWIMDDDCIPCTDSLEKLLVADRLLGGSDKYGFLSSRVLWKDGSDCLMNRQKFRKNTDPVLPDNIRPVTQATFVSLLFPASVVKKAGLPVKEFFIWGDDIEYTRRISVRMKIPSYMVEDSRVVHAMKENTGSNISDDVPERIDRYNYAFRNENYLYRQEGIKGFAYYMAKCGFNIMKILLKAKNNRLRRCGVIVRNMFAGLWFNPDIEVMDNEKMC